MPPHFKRDKIQKNERRDKYIVFRKKYINNKMSSNIISTVLSQIKVLPVRII